MRSRVLIWIFLCLILPTGCGDDAGDAGATTVAPPSPSTTDPGVLTAEPESDTTVDVSVRAGLAENVPPLLVADGDGVGLWVGGAWSDLVEGGAVELAIPDQVGGVICQGAQAGDDPVSIVWLPTIGGEAQVLVAADSLPGAWAIQVVGIGGHPTLVYRLWREQPSDCAVDDAECRWAAMVELLLLRDLVTMEDTTVGAIGSFESGSMSLHVGGDHAAMVVREYGDPEVCVGVVDLDAVLSSTQEDPPEWLGAGSGLVGSCVLGPTPGCSLDDRCTGAAVAAMAPDGSLLAYAQTVRTESGGMVAVGAPELVVVDPEDMGEVFRVAIGEIGEWPVSIDFDGTYAIVGLSTEEGGRAGSSVLVGPAGEVARLALGGRVSLWSVLAE